MIAIKIIVRIMIARKIIATYMIARSSLITDYFLMVYLKSWACTVNGDRDIEKAYLVGRGRSALTVFLSIYRFKKTETEYKEFEPRGLNFVSSTQNYIQYFKI